VKALEHITQRIRNMIEGFTIPRSDALDECLLLRQSGENTVIDAAILISSKQSEGFYKQYPESRIELENRTFSQAYVILDRPNIKSAVASSDGEYVAYFQTVPGANH
jgi:hypothetical protein